MIINTGAKYPKANIGAETIIKIYLILLLSQLKFLNFNENIGISETRKYEKRIISPNKSNHPAFRLKIQCPAPVIKDDQKSALAGVGKPIKVFV